jgi:hypothetical protein
MRREYCLLNRVNPKKAPFLDKRFFHDEKYVLRIKEAKRFMEYNITH